MKIIKRDEFKDSKWSSGVTTEVFIYPEDSNVADKNFEFRISTATCLDKVSVYTPYKGFNRYIAPLDNDMKIKTGDSEFLLKPYEVLYFDGDDNTKSSGDIRDFNLIFKKGLDAHMYSLNINNYQYKANNRTLIFNFESDLKIGNENFEKFSAVYLEKEKIDIEGSGKIIICEF